MRELNVILADCRVAFSQMSESEKANAAQTLVGKNAMSGFLALMNAAPADIQKLEGAISTCSDEIDGYNGVTEKMAAVMQDNLGGQLTILTSQLQELAISFGEILMPAIRAIVSKIQGLIDKLNAMYLPQEAQKSFTAALFALGGVVSRHATDVVKNGSQIADRFSITWFSSKQKRTRFQCFHIS